MNLSNELWLCQSPDGTVHSEEKPTVLLPGSFNPLHHGHRSLAEVASRKLDELVAFELSISNVDKPELSAEEVRRRLDQFLGFAPVYVTRAMTFENKAKLFPGVAMVVGCDTALRILDPRYYENDPDRRDQSLMMIRERGCRFLVAGRIVASGTFVELGGIEIPAMFRDLFEAIAEEDFRVDVSSTILRQSSTISSASQPTRSTS